MERDGVGADLPLKRDRAREAVEVARGDGAEVEGIVGKWVGELTGFTKSTGGPLVATGAEP